MHVLGICAIVTAGVAVIGLLIDGADDCWFFALLSTACLLQGMSEAYQEHDARTVGCLMGAAFFAGACLRALRKDRAPAGGGT
jgi:hypothetical protein